MNKCKIIIIITPNMNAYNWYILICQRHLELLPFFSYCFIRSQFVTQNNSWLKTCLVRHYLPWRHKKTCCDLTSGRAQLLLVHTTVYVVSAPLCKGFWVRITRKACWLAYCKMRLDSVGHPGIFGMLHSTY